MLGTVARLAAVGTAGAAYLIGLRPRMLHWGATETEAAEALPGDELVPAPRFAATRAITVAAPASGVWPWLVQLGQGRGGLYSYETLESLVGPEMRSTDDIVPELQDLAVGDAVPLVPIGAPGGIVMRVDRLEPPYVLVLQREAGADGEAAGDYFQGQLKASWALVIRELDPGSCRIVSRWRAGWAPSSVADLFNGVLVEPLQFLIEEKLLRGVRDRAVRAVAAE